MKLLFILALIPLSRVLFYFVLWLMHRSKNIEGEYGSVIATRMLDKLGAKVKVYIESQDNEDSFDPSTNIICLSKSNNRKTISSVAIAIHEVGHALQLNSNWKLYGFRCRIIVLKGPLIYLTAILTVIGFSMGVCRMLAVVSLMCLLACTIVELIVEINASIRGCKIYQKYFITNRKEMRKIRIFLCIAALTYFADIINCIYLVIRLVLQMIYNKANEENEA